MLEKIYFWLICLQINQIYDNLLQNIFYYYRWNCTKWPYDVLHNFLFAVKRKSLCVDSRGLNRVEKTGLYYSPWSTMTESVGNETTEKYWCFLSRNWHWLDFLTWDDIENTFGYVSYIYVITKMNRSNCYQQIQSFLITPYFTHNCIEIVSLYLGYHGRKFDIALHGL
jgi:hypothetical protein